MVATFACAQEGVPCPLWIESGHVQCTTGDVCYHGGTRLRNHLQVISDIVCDIRCRKRRLLEEESSFDPAVRHEGVMP